MANSDAFYNEIVAEVDAVLLELGKSYDVMGEGVYNNTTLTTTDGPVRPVTGLVADQQTSLQIGAISGNTGDYSWLGAKNLLLSPSANPQPDERINVDGVWYELNNIVEIKPADVAVLYILDIS
ncbi:MAG: hypothetical protein Unbinned4162contig1001_61 [Prokaryotic dsDNA virus sp.]|nr:MAG: hypothetical protein Unbinned4162contig1001_61 [Prokaryotic dsDNA virus sp.]|tara:strand:- start:46516 stop:46887 length:372 start_codon:yes stop_codon:yes gene_type:complete